VQKEATVVVDALLLALRHSGLSVDFEYQQARSVLLAHFSRFASDGVIRLQTAMEILRPLEGFRKENIPPACCRFKSWEERLGYKVALPRVISEYSLEEVYLESIKCEVPDAEVMDVFLAVDDEEDAEEEVTGAKGKKRSHTRPRLMMAAAAALLGVLAPVAIVLNVTAGGKLAEADVDFGRIPASQGVAAGQNVGGVLSDPAWRDLPAAERTSQMKETLTRLGHSKRALFIRDSDGDLVGVARWSSDGTIDVKFH